MKENGSRESTEKCLNFFTHVHRREWANCSRKGNLFDCLVPPTDSVHSADVSIKSNIKIAYSLVAERACETIWRYGEGAKFETISTEGFTSASGKINCNRNIYLIFQILSTPRIYYVIIDCIKFNYREYNFFAWRSCVYTRSSPPTHSAPIIPLARNHPLPFNVLVGPGHPTVHHQLQWYYCLG